MSWLLYLLHGCDSCINNLSEATDHELRGKITLPFLHCYRGDEQSCQLYRSSKTHRESSTKNQVYKSKNIVERMALSKNQRNKDVYLQHRE